MRRILVCQHVPYELLGTLNPLLRDAGFRMRYINFGRAPDARPTLDGYYGLVVLGGPMCVGDSRYPHLLHEIALIQDALARDIPVLGICLGAQLVAAALGADVGKHTAKEIGWYNLGLTDEGKTSRLFSHFQETEKIFQWHSDTFDIPRGAVHLASSPTCPNQAFRYGKKVYGLQFHLEVDGGIIDRWLEVPAHKEELVALKGVIEPATIRTETQQYLQRSMELSQSTFGAFADLFPPKPKRSFPSR